jgi:hypothetical protein
VQDGTGEKYRYAITKAIPKSQYTAGPPRISTF